MKTETKQCSACGETKPIAEYYFNRKHGTHGAECKPCVRARVAAYRLANLEKVREYDRKRGWTAARKAKNRANYYRRMATEAGRIASLLRVQKSNAKHPAKKAARCTLGNALRDGKIVKGPCAVCGSTKRIHGHHEDYSKHLDVVWLCPVHHGERHREINEERRKAKT